MAFTPDIACSYLEAAWRGGRLGHAYLISGLSSETRLDFAGRLARLVNDSPQEDIRLMTDEGVRVVEPESKSRRIVVDQVRELEKLLHRRAAPGRLKIGVIAEADRMGSEATNAFLRTLEEPPPSSLLLLLTGQPSLLLDTVLSRCIRVALYRPETGRPVRTPAEEKWLEALAAHFSAPPTAVRAMMLQRVFTGLLAAEKERITAEHKEEQAREVEMFGKTTDAAAWLKDREDHYAGRTASEYHRCRARFVELILLWFGDIIRLSTGASRSDIPEYAAVLASAARLWPVDDLLRRFRCVEDLLRYLDTTVNETLAVEMTFLGAFS